MAFTLDPVKIGTQLGSRIGSAVQSWNNSVVNDERAYNSAEAQKNRDFQEYMSNTAVQRQVADIKAAGLNPWLALNGGGVASASTPAGDSASGSSAFAQNYMLAQSNNAMVNAITRLASSALSVLGRLGGAALSGK